MSLTSGIQRLALHGRAAEKPLSTFAPLLWLSAACFAVTLAWLLQIEGRTPLLVWDEAGRVSTGEGLSDAIAHLSLPALWHWLHAQAFYPPLMPALHGLAGAAGAEPLTAAWLPSLLAYGLAGLLTANLARRLGLPIAGCALAAGLYWTAPLSVRLAAWGATEHIAACLFLLLASLLVQLERRPALGTAVAAGAIAGLTALLKYDSAVVALGTLGLSTAIALPLHGRRAFAMHALALVTFTLLAMAWLSFETGAKTAAFQEFLGQGNASETRGMRPLLYLDLLLQSTLDGERNPTGLAPLTGLMFFFGAVYAAYLAARRRLSPQAFLLLAIAMAMYSGSALKDVRFLGPLVPFYAIFAALLSVDAYRWAEPRLSGSRRAVVIAAAAVLAFSQVAWQVGGPQGLTSRFSYLEPSRDVEQLVSFTMAQLSGERGEVLLAGSTNWFSPRALQLAWHRPDGNVPPIRGLSPQGISRASNNELVAAALRDDRADPAVTLSLDPGSPLYTGDPHYENQRAAIAAIEGLEATGRVSKRGALSLQDGALRVDVWRIAERGALSLQALSP